MCAAGLRTAAAVACAEGVGAEDAAGARLKSRSEGLVGLKAHVVVANWALDVAGCFASASDSSSYARQAHNLRLLEAILLVLELLEAILLVLEGFGGATEARSRVPDDLSRSYCRCPPRKSS